MSEDLPSARYRVLVQAIGEHREHAHGWKSEASRLLGVSASYVSRVAGGRPYKIGRHAIEAAVQRIPGLTPEWFTSSGPIDSDALQKMIADGFATDRRDPVMVYPDANMASDHRLIVTFPLVKGTDTRNEWLSVQTMAESVMYCAERGELSKERDYLASGLIDNVRRLRLVELTDELERAEGDDRERVLMLLALHARMIAFAVLAASDPTATADTAKGRP